MIKIGAGPNQSRKYNKEQKISKIIDVTKEIIQSLGIEHTTTREITQRAKVSMGILYRYFPEGIPSILVKMAEQASESVISVEILNNLQNQTFDELLAALLQKNLEEHQNNRSLLRAFAVNFLLHPELSPKKQDLFYLDWDIMQQIFKHYKILDNLSNVEQKVRMDSLLFILDALTHEYIFNPAIYKTDAKFVEILSDVARHHLRMD